VSVAVRSTSLLSISPQLWWEHETLWIRTSRLLQVLGLGSYARTVAVCPKMKRIEITTRRLWFWTSARIIAFEDIAYLLYEFGSVGTDWVASRTTFSRADQLESFRIGLGLRSKEELWLTAFRGEGSVPTGALGVVFGDSLIDLQGDQEDQSRSLIDWLEKLTGAPLGRPLLDRGAIKVCAKCGRAGDPDALRCTCGGSFKLVR
jgi:hypothetical protein